MVRGLVRLASVISLALSLVIPCAIAQTAGPAAWQNDLTPISRGGLERRFRGASARTRRLRRNARRHRRPREADSPPGRRAPRSLRRRQHNPVAAIRRIPHPRPRPRTFPSQPPRRNRSGQSHRRSSRHQGETHRQPASSASGRQVLLLASRQHARNQSRRLLVGQPHADLAPAPAGKDGPLLAWPFRHQRAQGARLP